MNSELACLYRNQTASNSLISLALVQNHRDRSQSHTAFTRQSPVETDARSLSSKWFAPSQAQAEKRSKLPVRLKTRGTTRKRVRPRRDLNLLPL